MRLTFSWVTGVGALLATVVCAQGCGFILGLGDYTETNGSSSGSAGNGGGSGGSGGSGGAAPECQEPGDCPDPGGACKTRTCASHRCGVAAVPAGTAVPDQVDGDCQEVQCDGAGHEKTVPKNTDIQDDMKECTTDTCHAGAPEHENKAAGVACSEGTGTKCDGHGACVECTSPIDCSTNVCQSGLCVAASCVDGVKNPGESDIDCGGSCAPCDDGKMCNVPGDCVGGACNVGICCTPTTCAALGATCGPQPDGCGGMLDCDDGVKNGNETDVDCGGGSCAGCPQSDHCGDNGDCANSQCVDGYCCNTTCTANCFSCNVVGSLGTCAPVTVGNRDTNCSMDSGGRLACNGGGVCLGGSGHLCTLASQCASGCCEVTLGHGSQKTCTSC